jgi:hypothetical protein
VKGRTAWMAGVLGLLLISAAAGKDKDKDKEKPPSGQNVDSGSFGVFMGGQRVATETFSIVQNSGGSVIASEFKSEQGTQKALQSSQLKLSSAGEIIQYEWKETSPESIQAVVEPNNAFLMERTTTNSTDKPAEQPFLLPTSTSILDDYFFVQREVLLWKYLAASCRQDKGRLGCPLGQRTQFGTLNPHLRASAAVTVQFSGSEKVTIRGVERDLGKFELKSDSGDWIAWIDDQFKLIRILVADENTEVVRD